MYVCVLIILIISRKVYIDNKKVFKYNTYPFFILLWEGWRMEVKRLNTQITNNQNITNPEKLTKLLDKKKNS